MRTTNPDVPRSHLPTALLLWWAATTMAWWWLAFARLERAPEWLKRAQQVCFGSSATSLPDTYGWMTLVLGPLSILLALLVIYDGELEESLKRFLAHATGKAVGLTVLAAASLQAGSTVARVMDARAVAAAAKAIPSSDDEMPDTYPRLARTAPALDLVDQHGERVSGDTLAGAPYVVAFAFAHCQTVCPTLVQQVRAASEGFDAPVPILYVTLDPWRDTPSALPTIAKKWQLGANERVLSGPVDEVNGLLDAYRVPRGRDENTGDVTHPALAYVVDGKGDVAYALEGASLSWLPEAVRRARVPGGGTLARRDLP